MEAKGACLERKRVDLEDREEALEGQIGKVAYHVLSVTAMQSSYRLYFRQQSLLTPALFPNALSHDKPQLHPPPPLDPNLTCAPTAKLIFSTTPISKADISICSTIA